MKRLISMILAVAMIAFTALPALAEENPPVVKDVTINVEVKVEGVRGVVEPVKNFFVPVSNKVSDKEAKTIIENEIKSKVKFDQLSEYRKDSVEFTPEWTKGIEEAVKASFSVANMAQFRLVYSNKVTNLKEHLKDIYLPSGTTRAEVNRRIAEEIKGIKFEEGYEFESFQLIGTGVFEETEQDQEYTVYVYAKQKENTTPSNPSNPSNPTDPVQPGNDMDLNKEVAKLAEGITLKENADGKVVINVPAVKAGQVLDLRVMDAVTGAIFTQSVIEGAKEVIVPITGEVSKYQIALTLKDKATSKVSETLKVSKEIKVKDIKPQLNYAYIIEGRVVLNITSAVGLDEKEPILYRMKGDSDFKVIDRYFGYGKDYTYDDKWGWNENWGDDLFEKKTVYDPYKRLDKNDYAIDVNVPSTLQVIATDKMGNRTPIQIEIKKDNVALTTNQPKYLNELIKSAFDERVVKYKGNLTIIDEKTTINLFELYEKEILKEFKRFNIRDLSFYVNDEEQDKWQAVKFDEFGRYDVVVYNDRNSDEFRYTILCLGKDDNVKSYKIIKDAEAFSKDKFKGLDAIELTAVRKNKDMAARSFFIKFNDNYYLADAEIPFGNKDKVEIEIFRKGQSKGKGATIVRGTNVVDNTTVGITPNPNAMAPTDVVPTSWAYNYIMTGLRAGLIKGYTDGSFKPNNMISVKETLALVGRIALAQPNKAKPVDANVPTLTSSWGQAEITAALSRMQNGRMDLSDPDRAVTRGEVAYVINSVLNLNGFGGNAGFSDTLGTSFEQDINALVGAGLINGYTDGTYKPSLQISREELAKLIVLAYQK